MSQMNKIYHIDTYTYKRRTDDGSIKTEKVTCLKTDPCPTLREIQLYAQKRGVRIISFYCLSYSMVFFYVKKNSQTHFLQRFSSV